MYNRKGTYSLALMHTELIQFVVSDTNLCEFKNFFIGVCILFYLYSGDGTYATHYTIVSLTFQSKFCLNILAILLSKPNLILKAHFAARIYLKFLIFSPNNQFIFLTPTLNQKNV